VTSDSGLARAFFGDRPGHPVVIARRHWPEVLARISGDQGAGTYLRTRHDVEIVDCSDLAGGYDIDEPAQSATPRRRVCTEGGISPQNSP
jgi:molybdenum cofactor cytidylyltransferase